MPDDLPPLRATLRGRCDARVAERSFALAAGQSLRLGRMPRMSPADPAFHPDFGSDLVFPDDALLSNFQATLAWDGRRLIVSNRPGAANPLLDANREPRSSVDLAPGDTFHVGSSAFTLIAATEPAGEAISEAALEARRFTDPDVRMDALARLPDAVRRAADDRLADGLLDAVFAGVPRADFAALVQPAADGEPVRLLDARRLRPGGPPSRQLVRRAVMQFENVAFVWPPAATVGPAVGGATASFEVDWAVCVRLPGPLDHGLYLSGSGHGDGRPAALEEDVKFARLAADIYAGQRELRTLGRRERFLQQLVSRPVRAALEAPSPEEAMAPRETVATVLFCDLRGFTPLVERGAGNLRATWDRLSTALDQMTAAIADHDGVVGDFQGDAVMAFWGWPTPQADQIERAAKAALAIRRRFAGFADRPDHPLAELLQHPNRIPCGIGLAHGPAVAGRLGSSEQFKIGLFGPVVNRAARLEAATKKFGVPIVVDEAVWADLVTDPRAWCRTRRIAKFRPQGIAKPVLVSELLPPPQEPRPNLPEAGRKRFEAAVDHFLAGHWAAAVELLREVPDDGPAAYLLEYIGHANRPPADWDGAIAIEK